VTNNSTPVPLSSYVSIVQILDEKGHFRGNGFFFSPGYVLTCKHLTTQVDPGESTAVLSIAWGNEVFPVSIASQADQLDLAVLRLEGQTTASPRLPPWNGYDHQPLVTEVRILGFNEAGTYGLETLTRSWRADSPSYSLFTLDHPVLPGFSGSPVLTDQGVIGIVVASHADRTLVLPTSTISGWINEEGGDVPRLSWAPNASRERTKLPFASSGPIPYDSPSYVVRDVEHVLWKRAISPGLVCLYGSYQIGKSSALLRLEALAKQTHLVHYCDLDGKRTDDVTILTKEIFDGMNKDRIHVSSWEQLVQFSRDTPVLLLIDELGAMPPHVAKLVIPKFAWAVTQSNSHISVVATLPKRFDHYADEISLGNPRHIGPWMSIPLSSFSRSDIESLLYLLPAFPSSTLVDRMSDVVYWVNGAPTRIQSLCEELWSSSAPKEYEAVFERLCKGEE